MRPLRINVSASSQKLGTYSLLAQGGTPSAARPQVTENKRFSQPLNRSNREEARHSFVEQTGERSLEQSLIRELEEKLKETERKHSGVEEELKIVSLLFRTFLQQNSSFRAFLSRIQVFYEETTSLMLREADHLKKQLAKTNEDKELLEVALKRATEKAKLSLSSTKKEPEQRKQVAKWTLATNVPKEPEVRVRGESKDVISPSASEKPFARPTSVPKLNLEVLHRKVLSQTQQRGDIYIEDC